MSNSDRNTQLGDSNEPLGSATPLQHTRLLSQIKGDQHERNHNPFMGKQEIRHNIWQRTLSQSHLQRHSRGLVTLRQVFIGF